METKKTKYKKWKKWNPMTDEWNQKEYVKLVNKKYEENQRNLLLKSRQIY